MKIHTIVFAVIAALTLGAFGTAGAKDHGARKDRQAAMQQRAGPRKFQRGVDHRQANQRARIKQGWRSGDLNRKQVARLQGNQRQIAKMERRFGSDGHYDRFERRIIKHKLDRASKRIWRMKGKHYRARPGYRGHRNFKHSYRRPYIHQPRVHRVYPVYEDAPARSLGVDIETEAFRFSVNKSG
jgi:hypothetical protein